MRRPKPHTYENIAFVCISECPEQIRKSLSEFAVRKPGPKIPGLIIQDVLYETDYLNYIKTYHDAVVHGDYCVKMLRDKHGDYYQNPPIYRMEDILYVRISEYPVQYREKLRTEMYGARPIIEGMDPQDALYSVDYAEFCFRLSGEDDDRPVFIAPGG